jgi:hypothetical protein
LLFEIKEMGQNGIKWDGTGQNGMEPDKMGWNRTRNAINRTGLVLKMPLITTHEWQSGIDDTISNNHEWYLPFIIIPTL